MAKLHYVNHLSAQKKETEPDARLSGPNAYRRRSADSGPPPEERPDSARPMMAFAPRHRLPTRELQTLLKRAKVVSDDIALLRFRPRGVLPSRFAIIISRKVAPSAVRRNVLRRRIQGWLRERSYGFSGIDVVVMLKKKAAELTRREFFSALEKIFQKISC